jgi:DNA (cytosine-5)-methyltransferase 1
MFRLIREIKPQFVIGENVQGIINIQNGMVLRQVQDDLESEGFEVQCFLIPASGIGAWHQRYRVWIVAANTDTRLSIGENQEIQTRRDSITSSNKDVSNTNESLRRGGRTITHGGENKVWRFCVEEKGIRNNLRSKAVRCNVVPGKETWWQTQSNIYGVPNGISYELDKDRANRIKALGNAIVPQIAREFGLAIKKVLSDSDRNG